MQCTPIILAAGLLALTGCTQLKVESTVRSGYEHKLADVCVVLMPTRALDAPFFEQLKAELDAALKARKVRAAVLTVAPPAGPEATGTVSFLHENVPVGGPRKDQGPALPEAAELKARSGFPPAYLLTAWVSGTGRSAGNASASLLLTLKEFGPDRDVWKAVLRMEWPQSGFGVPGVMYSKETPIGLKPAEVAGRIIDQLKQDGLL